MAGGVVSRTVTTCVAVAELPASSVAVQVTVVDPSRNVEGASPATSTDRSTASVADAVSV